MKKAITIVLVILLLGFIFIFSLQNILLMYACVEGGGTWNWGKLACTPYRGEN